MGHDRGLVGKPTGKRLPRSTWVGLRAPWSVTACPLCQSSLKTMLKAHQHFKRLHNAGKVLCLCERCGTSSETVASSVRHASMCGSRILALSHGDHKCSHCTRTFATKRGLSQHTRRAHPSVYMSAPRRSLAPGMEGTRTPKKGAQPRLLLKPMDALTSEAPSNSLPNRLKDHLLSALKMVEAPSLEDINDRASDVLAYLRGRFSIRKPARFRLRPASKSKKRKKATLYRFLQRKWYKQRDAAASLVLDGQVPVCTFSAKEVEKHYRSIWEAPDSFKSFGGFGNLPAADNSFLTAPISSLEVVSSLKRVKPRSSPGPDGIRKKHLRWYDSKGVKLAALFNEWLVCGDIPTIFKRSRTTLIPKSLDISLAPSIKHWRPITLSSLILRIFTRILSNRLEMACPPHPRQRGFIESPGCSENLTVIDGLIKLAKRKRRPLAGAFVDMAKAFDTVPHRLIEASLKRRGLDVTIINLIINMYKGSNSRITAADGRTAKIFLRLGVKQGDPLSPILFNLSIDPLLYALDEYGKGIEVGSDFTVTSLAYADDLLILSDSWEGMKRNLEIVDLFSEQCGIRTNPSKTHAFLLSRVGNKIALNDCSPWELGGAAVHMIPPLGTARYLGVDISPLKGVSAPNCATQLRDWTKRIDESRLKPSQKMTLLREYTIPRLQYSLDFAGASITSLFEYDRIIRKFTKKWLHLGHHTTDGLLYSAAKDGGLSLSRLSMSIPAKRLRRFVAMRTSKEPLTNCVAKLVSLDRQIRLLYKHVTSLELPGTLEEALLGLADSAALRGREFKRWASLSSQGVGTSNFKADPVSNSWLLAPRASRLLEFEYVVALQLRTNTFPVRCNGASRVELNTDASCRLCLYPRETLCHIVSNCPVLKVNRMKNHNAIVSFLKREAANHGWLSWTEKHLTLQDGRMGVPDLVLLRGKVAHIVDVAVVMERNVSCLASMATAKKEKYVPFCGEVNRWLGAESVCTWGLPVGARGKWPRFNNELLVEIGLSKTRIRAVTKRLSVLALCGTIKTCRTFNMLVRRAPR